jgi:hypothetical protein
MTVKSEDFGLTLGSRVSLSRLGAERCSRCIGHTGKVVGFSRANGSIRVLLEGTKTPRSLHRTYLEPIDAKAAEPAEIQQHNPVVT